MSSKPEETQPPQKQSSSYRILAIFVAVIVLIVVIFVVVAQLQQDDPVILTNTELVYNGFEFFQDVDSFWVVTAYNTGGQAYQLKSYYTPDLLEDIPFDVSARNAIASKPVVISSLDSQLDNISAGAVGAIAAIEVGKVVGERYGIMNKQTATGVTNPGVNDTTPKFTCNSVTETQAVIIFTIQNQTAVIEDKGCVFVIGENKTELIRASDRLMFSLLGVMDQ